MCENLSRDIKCNCDKSSQELLEILARALDELKEYDSIKIENSRVSAAMAKDYMSLVDKCKSMEEEIKTLKNALDKSIQGNQLKTSHIYGRSTEKLAEIVDSPLVTEFVDEDAAETTTADVVPIDRASRKSRHNSDNRKRGKKTIGKREKDLENIPSVNIYNIDIKELNRIYGENNWRIVYWHSSRSIECIPTTIYEKITYTPVVSVGLEHEMHSIPRGNVLISNSIASASLSAQILYNKFFLALPIYRQEIYFKDLGLTLLRQTMNNWVNSHATEIFYPVYNKLTMLLMQAEYQQCDETFFQVNKDGRGAGTKSYMWVHITSELLKGHPIIVYCFELTRGTDHLRKFYKDFEGYITCDAYVSYHLLEKENAGVIFICGCMMHLRRRFAKSLSLIDTKKLVYETVEALPETKALKLIGDIYDEDEPLKNLSADKRKDIREEKVRPLMNNFYDYLDSLDVTDPLTSDQLRDAVQYAQNQKKYIYRFLDDGNIPIDNGATERAIRPFTIGRNNWIACDSKDGAEVAAIMYTIVETARANKVNVYYYLRYLLEQVPKYLDGKNLDFLDDMLPWSDKYLSYEEAQTSSIPKLVLKENEYDTKPKTPRKGHNGDPPNLVITHDAETA